MSVAGTSRARASRRVLMVGVVATACVCLTLLVPMRPEHRYVVLLLATWLVFAAVIRRMRIRGARSPAPARQIPVRFSGDFGRFSVRSLVDGRRVEVRDGDAVVAELVATDDGDHLVIDPGAADDTELEALGTALGRAIEMVVAADEGPSENDVADNPRRT
jgi:hypothetical protein